MDDRHDEKEERLPSTPANETAALIAELRTANRELQEARRAALELMEEALRSKEALRQSEEKYRVKLEQEVRDRTAELNATKERLQVTLDSSLYVIQAFQARRDQSGKIVDFTWVMNNRRAVEQNGDVIGKSLLEQNPGVKKTGLFEMFVEVTETGVPVDHEVFYSYEQFNSWFHQTLVKMGDGFVMSTEDITKTKKAQEELKRSRHLLQTTIDSSLDMIQVFEAVRNEKGEIVDFVWVLNNEASVRYYGNVIGESLLRRQPGVVKEGIFEAFRQVVETGVPLQYEKHYIHEQFDGWYYQSVVKIDDGVATTTTDITARKKSEADVLRLKDEVAQKATDKYKALFDSIDEGFAIQELITDTNGNVIDVIWREVNSAFEDLTGLKDVVGKKSSQLLPHLEKDWLDALTQVYKTGKPLRAENFTTDLNRWITYQYSRIGEAGSPFIAAVFNDITERKQRERRQDYLILLNEALRPLVDPVEVQRKAMQVLGTYLKVDRVVYADINVEEDYFEVNDNYTTGVVQKIIGRFPFSAFGSSVAILKSGETLVIDDVNVAVPNDDRAQFFAIEVQAVVAVPLVKGGKLVMDLSLHQTTPRHWRADEIALAKETAERTWAAVERAKAEAALRKSEEKYRTLFETIEEGFCIMELVRNEQGDVVDVIYREVNKAFERHTGLANIIGKRSTETIPNQDPNRFKFYQQLSETGETTLEELYINDVNRWLRLYRMRIGGTDSNFIAAVFEDITERKQREANLAFLAEISLDFAPLLTVHDVMEQVVERLANHFQLSRCHLSIVDEEKDRLEVVYEYRRNKELPSIMGRHHILDNLTEEGRKHFKAGKLAVVDSAENSWLRQTPAELLQQFGFGSLLDVPHIEGGRWTFLLTLGRVEPGGWRKDEVEMLEDLSSKIFTRIERARAEEALRSSEERLQSIANLVPDLLWDSEPDGSTRWYNQRWLEYTGQSFEEAIGWGWLEAIHPDDRQASSQHYRAAVDSGDILRQEHRIRRFDGEYRWFVVSAFPHKDDNGKVIKMYSAATDIHETRLMNEALRESEARLRILADAVPQLIWTNDAEGRANYFNQRWYDFTGLSFEQSKGLGWQAVVNRDDELVSKEKWQQALAKGVAFEKEYRLRRRDGSYCWFIGRTVALLNRAGAITGWFGTATDIESLKKTEEALSQSEARLRITMESATDYAIITTDTNRRVERWSQGAMELFQYTEEEVRGQLADIIFTEEDKATDQPQKEMATARDTGRAADERWHQRKDGSRFFASGVMRPIKNGEITGYVKVLRDVTEQKESEEKVRIMEERNRIALQSAELAAWDWNIREDRVEWNDQHFFLLGLQPSASPKDSAFFLRFVHPEDRDKVVEVLREAVETLGVYQAEFRVVRDDGEVRWMSGYGRVVAYSPAGAATRMVGVMLDSTTQKQFTEELHRLVAERTLELQRSNENLQQFATIAAHDLQEPLRKLRLFSSVLQRYKNNLPDEGSELLGKISLTSERMSQLIREVLQYSRLNSGVNDFEPLNLDEVLQDVLRELELPLRETGAQINYTDQLPQIDGSPSQMAQLFYNLLTNALKFRHEGETPVVNISAAPLPAPELAKYSFLLPEKRYIQITVADKGIGFDPQFSEQIFQIFERLHSVDEFEGTGVGLALCKKIVENHSGHIFANAKEGEGATFTIILPVSSGIVF